MGESYSDADKRLAEIVEQVKKRDCSIEQSLDLFDEAIEVGTRAVELVDTSEFAPEELEQFEVTEAAEAEEASAPESNA